MIDRKDGEKKKNEYGERKVNDEGLENIRRFSGSERSNRSSWDMHDQSYAQRHT